MAARPDPLALAYRYCDEVLAEKQVAGELERRYVERFYHDLDHGAERGLYFDEDAARNVLEFFPNVLVLPDGRGTNAFRLEPFQCAFIAQLFGWKRESDGLRRYRVAYFDIGRKNGKTALVAGIGHALLTIDGEYGAEVFSVATKKAQANVSHRAARSMARRSEVLSQELIVFPRVEGPRNVDGVITYPPLGASWYVLGRDSKTEDGSAPHAGLVDEYHAHRDAELYSILETGMGARSQPLMIVTTTAGFDVASPCFEMRADVIQLLRNFDNPTGPHDDTTLGVIYTLDGYDRGSAHREPDDPHDPTVWRKSNPGLGTIKNPDQLSRLSDQAKRINSKLPSYLVKECNVWTNAAQSWLPVGSWVQCPSDPIPWEQWRGRRCWAGLDLASRNDLCAFVLVSEREAGGLDVYVRCWTNEHAVRNWQHAKGSSAWQGWVRQGFLHANPGDTIDYGPVEAFVLEAAEHVQLERVLYDPWNAARTVQHLEDAGIELQQVRQGFGSMNNPMKELEQLILRQQINGGGNPVLDWALRNVQSKSDPAGNIKPDRSLSSGKIDPAVALIMAVAGWLEDSDEMGDRELLVI
jgi:phage terminase large subunit-like protein